MFCCVCRSLDTEVIDRRQNYCVSSSYHVFFSFVLQEARPEPQLEDYPHTEEGFKKYMKDKEVWRLEVTGETLIASGSVPASDKQKKKPEKPKEKMPLGCYAVNFFDDAAPPPDRQHAIALALAGPVCRTTGTCIGFCKLPATGIVRNGRGAELEGVEVRHGNDLGEGGLQAFSQSPFTKKVDEYNRYHPTVTLIDENLRGNNKYLTSGGASMKVDPKTDTSDGKLRNYNLPLAAAAQSCKDLTFYG